VDSAKGEGRGGNALGGEIGANHVDGGDGGFDRGEAEVEGGSKALDVDPNRVAVGGSAKEGEDEFGGRGFGPDLWLFDRQVGLVGLRLVG